MHAMQLCSLSKMLSCVIPPSANAVMSAIMDVVPAPYPYSTRDVKIARYFAHALAKSTHAKQDLDISSHEF